MLFAFVHICLRYIVVSVYTLLVGFFPGYPRRFRERKSNKTLPLSKKVTTKHILPEKSGAEMTQDSPLRPSFSLKHRVRYDICTIGWVLPICGKPSLLKMLQANPTLLNAYFQAALDSHPGDDFAVFIANGRPMAQQIGAFVNRGSLARTQREVAEACIGLEKLCREAIVSLSEADQRRIQVIIRWEDLTLGDARYEKWYQFIMSNEETRDIIKKAALDIIQYRVDSFTKKGLKCKKFFDEAGELLVKESIQKRFLWTQESIAREICTLNWGFHFTHMYDYGGCKAERKFHLNSVIYLTPNSTGMDLISGAAWAIRNLIEMKQLRNDLPKQARLHYMDLSFLPLEPAKISHPSTVSRRESGACDKLHFSFSNASFGSTETPISPRIGGA